MALAIVLVLAIWIRRQWLAGRSSAGSAAISQPNATPPRVSRRTLLVGGVVVGLELVGVGWFISKLPALIPQRKFKLAIAFKQFPLIAWAPDGRRLVGLGDGGALTVWDATTGATLQRLPIVIDNLLGFAWSPDGAQIAIGSVSNVLGAAAEILLWDVASQRMTRTYLDSYAQPQTSPTVFWQGSRVGFLTATTASGKAVADIYLWDALTNTNRKLFSAQNFPDTLVFSPDGRYLAAMDGIGTLTETQVSIWDALTWQLIITHTFVKRDELDDMQTLTWSPDGRRLALGAAYNCALVMDALTGAHRQTLQGPLDSFNMFPDMTEIRSISWSPDSRYLATASDDTTVRIWRDMPDGQPQSVFVWIGHLAPVDTVVWSPSGKLIASGDANHTVQIWRPQGDLWGGA
ncbi:MAG TPA: hypothetical protein VMV29_14225 [Ktedonobacterales bacterium]|nr:hypothetical protein [Ktedonobacterales bacterium]